MGYDNLRRNAARFVALSAAFLSLQGPLSSIAVSDYTGQGFIGTSREALVEPI